MGALATSVIQLAIAGLGDAPTYTFLGCLVIVQLPLYFMLRKYGETWSEERKGRQDSKDRKQAKNDASKFKV